MLDIDSLHSQIQNIDLLPIKQQISIGIALPLLLGACFYLALIQPMQHKLFEVNNALSLQQQKLNQQTTSQFSQENWLIANELMLLDQRIPKRIQISDLITKINQLAYSRDLSVTQIKVLETTSYNQTPTEVTGNNPFQIDSVQLSTTGDFDNLAAFLSDLSALDSVVIANQWHFEKHSSKQGATLSLHATILCYQQKPFASQVIQHAQQALSNTVVSRDLNDSNLKNSNHSIQPKFDYIAYHGSKNKDLFAIKSGIAEPEDQTIAFSKGQIHASKKNLWVMLGTMQKDQAKWGLIGGGSGKIMAVQEGDFIGNSRAVVDHILDSGIAITDLRQDETGKWFQQSYVIEMQRERKQ